MRALQQMLINFRVVKMLSSNKIGKLGKSFNILHTKIKPLRHKLLN